MGKNSAVTMLKRWQAMDKALCDSIVGLHVESFARKHKVSTKTVQRDREAFEELGQKLQFVPRESGDTNHWTYAPGVEPLFVASLSRGQRRRITG